MAFDYFYGAQSQQFAFYRIPKVMFTDNRFQNISTEGKVLYGLLLDRVSLSMENGWIDDDGRLYIIFTLTTIRQSMNCAEKSAIKYLTELEEFGLIERIRQGFGKPALIYVKNFIDQQNLQVKTSKNYSSPPVKVTGQDLYNLQPNYTYNNNTDFNNINPIHQSEKLSHPHNESWIEKYNKTISQIKSQISYDSLILTNDTGIINDIVEVMADVMLLDTPSYKIEKKDIPSEIVRIRYKQLTYEKIETLLLDFNNITYEIHSKTSYLISSLYNISKTAETSLTNRVKHNMYDLC